MNAKTGLWIDHRKAVVVAITDKGEEIKQILSNVERQRGRIDGIRSVAPYESQLVAADDSHQREFTGHLNVYYDEVLSSVRDAETILLMGPGEAKGELKKRLSKNHLGERIADIVTADKMTVPQIAAKVRKYFLN
jgi:stalled ribosome rescue protein Dom34